VHTARLTSGCTGARAAEIRGCIQGRRAGPVNLIVSLLRDISKVGESDCMRLSDAVIQAMIRVFGIFVLAGSLMATVLGSTHMLHPRQGASDYRFLFYFGLAGIASGIGLALLRKWGALIVAFVGTYYMALLADGISRVGFRSDLILPLVISILMIVGPGFVLVMCWRHLRWR
jgi:hypothetical protein